jgi:hypothetical protein
VINDLPDPLLPPFLRKLAQLDGLVTSEVWSGKTPAHQPQSFLAQFAQIN